VLVLLLLGTTAGCYRVPDGKLAIEASLLTNLREATLLTILRRHDPSSTQVDDALRR